MVTSYPFRFNILVTSRAFSYVSPATYWSAIIFTIFFGKIGIVFVIILFTRFVVNQNYIELIKKYNNK